MINVLRQLSPIAFVLACNFDATGFGDPPPASAGDTTTASAASTGSAPATTDPIDPIDPTTSTSTTSTTELSTSGATTFPLTSTDPSTTSIDPSTTWATSTGPDDTTGEPDTTGDDTTTSSTSSTTSTTGPVSCADMPYKQIIKVADATTVAPMVKAMSQQQVEGMVAYSEVAEQGTVSFTIDVPCDGQLAVWGRVRDFKPGISQNGDDPDSFYPRIDDGPESSWFYGCQTGGETSAYRWKRVRSGVQGQPCDNNTVWLVSVTAGTHTITLRNRESKSQNGGVAVIARLLVTSDLDAMPAPGD